MGPDTTCIGPLASSRQPPTLILEARSSRWETARHASRTALPRYRRLAVGRGIEHHLDHALDVAIHRRQGADVDAQAAGDGRAHGLDVELLALDLAGLDHVLGERRQACLIAQRHADVGQTPHQQSPGHG
jgi:hypothetical protein